MIIQPTTLTFQSKLKKLYKQGKLDGLKSFSGQELKTPSDEHVLPRSQGGTKKLSNLVLTNCKENSQRGDKNIDYFIEKNEQGAIEYIGWFLTHKIDGFDCKQYAINLIRKLNKVSKKYKFKIDKYIEIE